MPVFAMHSQFSKYCHVSGILEFSGYEVMTFLPLTDFSHHCFTCKYW